jgi:hypothetical protein
LRDDQAGCGFKTELPSQTAGILVSFYDIIHEPHLLSTVPSILHRSKVWRRLVSRDRGWRYQRVIHKTGGVGLDVMLVFAERTLIRVGSRGGNTR